jgi:RNA polymerase sigma-70 factor (ECF subfamily)
MSDEETFRRWIADHRGLVLRITRAYAADAADEDDLQQEILLAVWRSLPGFRGDAKPSTWLFRVALNVALARRRATGRRVDTTPLEHVDAPATDGEAAAFHRLQWTRVLAALREIPPADRAILLLALEGATQQDVADVLGITPTNAGVKLHRARRRLLARLEA